jgi:hypothetical protein
MRRACASVVSPAGKLEDRQPPARRAIDVAKVNRRARFVAGPGHYLNDATHSCILEVERGGAQRGNLVDCGGFEEAPYE